MMFLYYLDETPPSIFSLEFRSGERLVGFGFFDGSFYIDYRATTLIFFLLEDAIKELRRYL